MYIDEFNYIPISLLVLLIIGVCVTFLTLFKSVKKQKNVKHIRIISICVLIFGGIGIAINVLKGYYFNTLESDILIKQSMNFIVLYPSKDVYYKVNTKYGIIKSIDENEYTEQSRVQSEYRETVLKESQQILEFAGYDVLIEYGDPCLITINNNIYFAVDNGNGEPSYLKYDNSTASVDNNFSPKFLSKGNIKVLSRLKEIAAVDTYPELTNCIQKYETNKVEYGEIVISDDRIVVSMLDNSEPYTANWLLYKYDQPLNELKLLCKTHPYNTEDIFFLK